MGSDDVDDDVSDCEEEDPVAGVEEAGDVLPDFCELTVGLVECCTHITYSIVSSLPHCSSAQEGCVDPYTVHKACLEIELRIASDL